MLVLARQRDESIMLGDDVEVTVASVSGEKVRLLITAPRHIQVHRREVYEAIARGNQDLKQINRPDSGVAEAGKGAGQSTSSRCDRKPRLVLTRYRNESIMIGDDMEVTVNSIRAGKIVRLAIAVPPHVQICCKEVYGGPDGGRFKP